MLRKDDVKLSLMVWNEWRAVLEHGPDTASSPLLLDREQFDRFLKEYAVRRTIRKGTSEALRERLRDTSWCDAVHDETGEAIDRQEQSLRPEFGTCGGQRGLISVLSKIASLMRPHAFNAWDQFARAGVNVALGRPQGKPFGSYADFLRDVNRLLAGDLGDRVRAFCADHYPTPYAAAADRFSRRVLDVHLMRLGGRWR